GYSNLGRPYLVIFSILSAISAVVNTAALLLFSASLLSYFIPFDLATSTLCMIVLATCLIILFAGHYRALDTLSKSIMAILTITTLAAVAIAIGSPVEPDAAFVPPSPWSLAAIGF
ncbi:divalent metal cation transporter, partial [Vibrio sp. 10N.286.49.E1]